MGDRAHNFRDISGQKFGKLTAIKYHSTKVKDAFWECLCECGKVCVKRGQHIIKGGTTSCGCSKKTLQRGEKGASGFNRLYKEYIRGARDRGLSFNLTVDQVKELTNQDCHYCKVPPSQISCSTNTKNTKEGMEHSKYLYNGIDRMDNSKGYSIDNCVPCCIVCNRAKMAMEYSDFINYINRFKEGK